MKTKHYIKLRFCVGMTLLEIVIALALMVVVFAAVLPQFKNIQNTWGVRQGNAVVIQNGRVLIDHLNRRLSDARRITAVSASSEIKGFIEFEDNAGKTIRFDVGPNNYIRYGPVGSLSDLAGPVNRLQFTCYSLFDLDNPTINVSQIRCVSVDSTFANSASFGQDKSFETVAFLRTNANNLLPLTCAEASGSITTENSGKIVGTKNIVDESEMPTLTEPSMGPNTGDTSYTGGTAIIKNDIHCDKFTVSDTNLKIIGDVTILAQDDVNISFQSAIDLLGDGTLTIYVKKKFTVTDQTNFNTTSDPSRALVLSLGNSPIEISDECTAYLSVIAPQSDYYVSDQTAVAGLCQVKNFLVADSTTFTVDAGTSNPLLYTFVEIRP